MFISVIFMCGMAAGPSTLNRKVLWETWDQVRTYYRAMIDMIDTIDSWAFRRFALSQPPA